MRNDATTGLKTNDIPPVTKTDIVNGLRCLGIRAGDSLFAHSSLSAFGRVDGGAQAVCEALLETAGRSGTVAVPAFTWGMNHAKEVVRFDVRNTPCEVGAIPEAFRKHPDAVRDEHVCHSIAAIGPGACEVLGDGVRPFAQGSGMYRVYEQDFWYLFLGCGFYSCTALHTAEETVQVPYRYYRHYAGSTIIRADGSEVPARSVEFLRLQPYVNDFAKMEALYEERGILHTTTVGAARIIAAKACSIVETAVEMLRRDVGLLLTDASRRYLADSRPFTPP